MNYIITFLKSTEKNSVIHISNPYCPCRFPIILSQFLKWELHFIYEALNVTLQELGLENEVEVNSLLAVFTNHQLRDCKHDTFFVQISKSGSPATFSFSSSVSGTWSSSHGTQVIISFPLKFNMFYITVKANRQHAAPLLVITTKLPG